MEQHEKISQTPFPNSKKVYIKGNLFPIEVAMREITLNDTKLSNGVVEKNPSVTVYDTSGPYTDPNITIDIRKGIPRIREQWILDREDVTILDNITSAYGQARLHDEKLDHLRFEFRHKPKVAKDNANVTQLYYAKKGIITPEMEYVAIRENQKIVMTLINKAIIPFLPLFIFGIFLNMTYNGQVFVVLDTFVKIIGVIFVLHIFVLLFQYTIAGIVSKRNPLELMKNMLPAYFTALGTQSSAAAIPVTLEQTLKNKVDPTIAGFTIPLCATIHLGGSTLKIVACAIALMLVQGSAIDPLQIVGFIFMLGIAMVAAPGVPGGAIMASLGVLHSILGFDTEQQSLMIALYIAMDSFGTACNVMGDGAIAIVVNKISAKSLA